MPRPSAAGSPHNADEILELIPTPGSTDSPRDAFKPEDSERNAGSPVSDAGTAVQQSQGHRREVRIFKLVTIAFGGALIGVLWFYWTYHYYVSPKAWWPKSAEIDMTESPLFELGFGFLLCVISAAIAAFSFRLSNDIHLINVRVIFGREFEEFTFTIILLPSGFLALAIAVVAYMQGAARFHPPRCVRRDSTPVYVFMHRESGTADVYTYYTTTADGNHPTAVFSLSSTDPAGAGNLTAATTSFTLSRTGGDFSAAPLNVTYDLAAGTAILTSLNLTATLPAGSEDMTPIYFPPELDTTLEAWSSGDGSLSGTTVNAVNAFGSRQTLIRVLAHAPGDCSVLSMCIASSQGLGAAKILIPFGLLLRRHVLDTMSC